MFGQMLERASFHLRWLCCLQRTWQQSFTMLYFNEQAGLTPAKESAMLWLVEAVFTATNRSHQAGPIVCR